jgi:motility quorum-sensing regulator/GCU-specific mRNA interferase toxin
MEKKKPHYNLIDVKKLIQAKQVQITYKASENAQIDFGFSEKNIIKEVLELEQINFYKSMTSNNNHKIWQDVYHKKINFQTAYIKIQIVNEKTVIIQFKKK